MFSRSAPNVMDEPVAKATDEHLTSENWEAILTVCDKVDADPENGARNAIASVTKRLGHRNANVQLYALSLAEALSKNCGSKAHREIASRVFTQALFRLVSDRTIHDRVKSRTAELTASWAEEFRRDPSLGLMSETNNHIKSLGITVKPPPSRPQKQKITDADRRREEEELQMALSLSLKETDVSKTTPYPAEQSVNRRQEVDDGPNPYTLPKTQSNGDYQLPTSSSSNAYNRVQTAQVQQTPIADRTAATVSRVRALYDFTASEAGELSFRRGDVIQVIESAYKDWWRGSLHGHIGIFPTNYVENLAEPTPADLQREAEEEQRVFAEAKNVEKLLSILSSAESHDPKLADNEQLQDLYHSTIAIRPKLVRLIEKYAQKKDDLISLNDKFMRARKDYDELMEASLSRYNTSGYSSRIQANPRQGSYQQYPSGSDSGRSRYSGDPRMSGSGPEQGYPRQLPPQQADNYYRSDTGSNRVLSAQAPYNGQAQNYYALQQQQQQQPQAMYSPSNERLRQTYHNNAAQQMSPRITGAYPIEPQSYNPGNASRAQPSQPLPTSPSQDLAQLSFDAPEVPDTSTYDHERAEREGGPPIAYYSDGAVSNPSGPAQSEQSLQPSAPNYAEEDIPDYYKRAS